MLNRLKAIKTGVFTKITVLFDIILICTVILVAANTVSKLTSITKTQEEELGSRRLEEFCEYFQEKSERFYGLSNYLVSSEISDILIDIKENPDAFYNLDNIKFISVFFEGVTSADPDFSDVIIATPDGRSYSFTRKGTPEVRTHYNFFNNEKIEALLESDATRTIISEDPSVYCLREREPVISFVGKILDTSALPRMKVIGVFIMNLPLNTVENAVSFDMNAWNAQIGMTDRDGRYIYCSDRSKIGSMIQDNGSENDWFRAVREIRSAGLSAEYSVPEDALYHETSRLKTQIILSCIAAIIITVLIVSFINHIYTKKINDLLIHMKRVETGDLSSRMVCSGNDEIAMLSESFNKMCEQLDSYIEKVYETELERKSAEVSALQMQINPHFLYNTLESIKAQAILEGDTVAPEMIVLLGSMFRWACRIDEKYVTIDEELEYVKKYLKLQSYRYPGKIAVDVSVEDEYLDFAIPKLTLQPVIENVVVHGFAETDRNCRVMIEIKKNGNELIITVSDNGCGMSPEELETVRLTLEPGVRQRPLSSIGIQNVNNRLRLLFGDRSGLTISSVKEKGTTVTIVLPALSVEEMNSCV